MQGPGGVVIVAERASPPRVSIELGATSRHDDIRAAVAAAVRWRDAIHETELKVCGSTAVTAHDVTMVRISRRQRAGETCARLAAELTADLNGRARNADARFPRGAVDDIAFVLECYGFTAEGARARAAAAVAHAHADAPAFGRGDPFDGDALRDRLQAWRRSPEGKRLERARQNSTETTRDK
jgi:hypothetical protein